MKNNYQNMLNSSLKKNLNFKPNITSAYQSKHNRLGYLNIYDEYNNLE